MRGHSGGATAVAFEDQTTVLTGDSDGVIRRWKLAGDGEPELLPRHTSAAVALHAAPNGDGIAVTREGAVRSLAPVLRPTSIERRNVPPNDGKTTVAAESLKPRAVVPLGGTLANPSLSPNGRALYVLDRTEHRILRLDAATLETAAVFPAREGVETFALSPDGTAVYVVSGRDSRGTMDVLDATTLRPRRSVALESRPYDIAAGPNGLAFVSGGGHGWTEVRVIDSARGIVVTNWGGVWARSLLEATPDGTRLLTCTQGVSPTRVEALVIPTPLTDKPATHTAPAEVAVGGPIVVSPDGQYLLCGTGAVLSLSTVRADDLRPAARIEPFLAACVVPDRKSILTLSDDSLLHVYDYPSFRPRATARLAAAAFAMTLDSASGKLYVTGVAPQTLRDRPRAREYGDVMVFDVTGVLQ